MLNPDAAARAGLDGSLIRFTVQIGSVKVKADSSLTRVAVGSFKGGRRVFWGDRNVIEGGADGIVSPDLLPENRVTLLLHAPAAGERIIELPVEKAMFLGLRHKITLGEENVSINFATHQPLSVATAAAGAHLAAMQDGHWAGEPQPVLILMGIERPGRPMALRQPLNLNGLPSQSFLVRTADFRGSFQLPPDEEADPDEITVTGKTSKGRASLVLTLGQDALGRCSSISYNKSRKMMTLRCL